MEFTKEMIEKAKSAKNAEELAKMAKDAGMELSAEDAEKAFAELHKSGELADDELDNVSGGGCGGEDNSSPDGRAKSEDAVVFMYTVGRPSE